MNLTPVKSSLHFFLFLVLLRFLQILTSAKKITVLKPEKSSRTFLRLENMLIRQLYGRIPIRLNEVYLTSPLLSCYKQLAWVSLSVIGTYRTLDNLERVFKLKVFECFFCLLQPSNDQSTLSLFVFIYSLPLCNLSKL